MSLLKGLGFCILTVLQYGAIVALYWLLSIALYYFVSPYMPGYYEDSGLRDAQAFLTTFLIWDRFFGPYATLLRKVGGYINQAERED